ncbi:fimbria/pilus outer membrane usher protein [Sphingomonas sp. AX6]|uniref:fimbria/pilus outer membrane usher protein n=1 Tax=Sphingomonas sp. AX6 TaxID=2653171 RepID=UPI0012F13A80|nr:fimbria/pilus outer membrane usher protein [Sphingomonas sp. AX6]VXC61219.1 Sigma-fimbriae usher protein [Sphingomonas sp. AX6]
MIRLLALLLSWCALLSPLVASAQGAGTPLFVELVVNGRAHPELVEIESISDALWVPNAALMAAGIAIEGDGRTDVAHDSRFTADYDPLGQRLSLTVAITLLPIAHHASVATARIIAESGTGLAFSYDLNVQVGGSHVGGGLWTEQRWFSSGGSLSNNGVLRFGNGPTAYLRYDTHFRRVDAERALHLVAGDLISGGLNWTRAYRMGGIQIGRAWRIRPDLITMPLPRFAGEAAVPSAVDLFIDGQRQQQRAVDPGRFVIEDLPVVTGAGNARIVTTDAVGRQIATDIPFYVAPDLLARGLTDFGLETGLVRRRYGQSSFDYGMVAASGFVRHGLNDRLTIEGHGEASTRSAAAGIGAAWMPGLFGTVHANVTLGRADAGTGHLWSAGYSYIARRWSLSADHRRASRDFRSIADLDARALAVGGNSTRVFASGNFERWGNVGLGYLDVRPAQGPRARLATASWSLPLGSRVAGFAGVDYDIDRRRLGLQVRVSMALGGASISVGARRAGRDRAQVHAEYGSAVPYAGGIGINAGIAADAGGFHQGQATLTARGQSAQANAGVAFSGNRAIGLMGVSGSVIVMDGGVHLANGTSSAFALVSTEGVAGVPVRYENQIVGVTNRRGHVFVPRVAPYHAARYSIDPIGLDADLSPSVVERRVAIVEGSGAVIRMPIHRTASVTLGLVDAQGSAIPAGSIADLGGQVLSIGWDGVLFVGDAPASLAFSVTRQDGGSCRVSVTMPEVRKGLDHIGGVPCV